MATHGMGVKYDGGKPRWDLLPIAPVREIVRVLTIVTTEAKKPKPYAPNNWQHVPGARDRYYAAMMRHITDWRDGEIYDKEFGLPCLAHAGCCLLFLLWFDLTGKWPDDEVQ